MIKSKPGLFIDECRDMVSHSYGLVSLHAAIIIRYAYFKKGAFALF